MEGKGHDNVHTHHVLKTSLPRQWSLGEELRLLYLLGEGLRRLILESSLDPLPELLPPLGAPPPPPPPPPPPL